MNFDRYEALTIDAQFLLCYYVHIAAGSTKSLDEHIKLIQKHCNPQFGGSRAKSELIAQDILQQQGYSWYTHSYNVVISDEQFMLALCFLYEKHEDWIKLFEKTRMSGGLQYNDIRKLMSEYYKSGCTKVTFPAMLAHKTTTVGFLLPLIVDDKYHNLLRHIPEGLAVRYFAVVLNYLCELDILIPADTLRGIVEDNTQLSLSSRRECLSSIDLYDYIATGAVPQQVSKTHVEAQVLSGLYFTMHGLYADAINVFAKALKSRNGSHSIKNVFYSAFLQYILVMAYHKEGSEASKTKITQFLRKDIGNDVLFTPSAIIARHLVNDWQEYYGDAAKKLFRSGELSPSRIYMYLAGLFLEYLDIENGVLSDKPLPNLLLVRHELQQYLNMTDEERERLDTLFGGKPLLTSIRRKRKWETVIEELGGNLDAPSTSVAPQQKTSRLAYFLNDYHSYTSVDVKEQTIKKNGEWGVGKAVSMTRFRDGDIDCMDDADRRVVAKLLNTYDWSLQLEHIIEAMAGSDRVFTGNSAPYKQVHIFEDKPYVTITKTNKGFVIKSNVQPARVENGLQIVKLKPTQYSYLRVTTDQLNKYTRLLDLGVFPFEAEDTLRAFLPKLGASVEIHSDLIEGGATIPQTDGSPLLCMQVTPLPNNMYDLSINVRPLPGGKMTFDPGKGDAMVIDEKDGQRIRVNRDIKGEKANFKDFKDFYKESFGEKLDDYELSMDIEEFVPVVDYMQNNKDKVVVEWPEGKKMKVLQATGQSWNGSLMKKGEWFEIEGDLQVDEDTVLTMSQLLDLVAQSRSRFIRLGDGEFLALSDRLRKQLRALEAIATRQKGKIQISPFSAALLSDENINGEMTLELDKNIKSMRKRIIDSSEYAPEVPAELNATLRPYQKDGYQWMARLNSWGAGALLADDMGLGKTIQTITFLLLKKGEGPSLVVAPASVAPNWRSELEKFAPSLTCRLLNFEADRKAAIEGAQAGDVVVTSYGLLLSQKDIMTKKQWNVVCLDEAHVIKNRGAKTSGVAMKLKAAYKVMLTGTPVQNHLSELWSLFQFLNPGLLGNFEDFSRRFIVPIEGNHDKERQADLDRMVHPFMLRRTKQSVLKDLPEKTEIYQDIELDDDEMAIYEVMRQKAEAMLELIGDNKIDMNVLAEITKLRQAACSVSLVEKKWKGASTKVTSLLEQLEGVLESDGHALVFSQFTSFLAIVKKALDDAHIPYLYIDGSVPVKKRTELVQEFQDGKCPLFLISLKAGGLGLNLTRANYVFHMDPWWNPAIEQQATDRAHRIGQKQAVTVYHMIAKNTIEEKIIRLHELKRDLADNVLEGTDMSHTLTGKDLLEMVR